MPGSGEFDSTGQNLDLLDSKGFLAFMNDPGTTFEVLDLACEIRRDSAAKIIAHRDGKDRDPGSADDNPFDSIEELDDVKTVGSATLEQLYLCAYSHGRLFTDEAGLMAFLNDSAVATFDVLDVDCAIRSDSAANIVAHREGSDGSFDTLQEVFDVHMVGLWTVERLYHCAEMHGYLDPTGQRPQPEPETSEFVYNLDQLEPALRDKVEGELMKRAVENSDHEIIFPVRFAEVEIISSGSNPVRYVVRFVQTLDPECGVQLWLVFTLDSSLALLSEDIYV
jgi:hypothetical protein